MLLTTGEDLYLEVRVALGKEFDVWVYNGLSFTNFGKLFTHHVERYGLASFVPLEPEGYIYEVHRTKWWKFGKPTRRVDVRRHRAGAPVDRLNAAAEILDYAILGDASATVLRRVG
jgi:hypothetical protein